MTRGSHALVVMSSGECDADLIGRSLSEAAAFGALYDRHAPALAAYLTRRVTADQVEGLLADVFVAAFEQRQRFDRGRTSALPWLYGIARNLVRRHYRSTSRERRATDRLASLAAVDVGPRSSFEEAVLDTADADADLDRVLTTLAAQPEIDRDVLLLFAWEDLGYSEIAEVLDIPVGTVKSRLNRVRQKLRSAR